MFRRSEKMKRKILSLFLVLCMALIPVTSVNALKITEAGNIVNAEGNYDSTRFLAGNMVNDKSTIDGISFVAGNEVTVEGRSTYGFYAGNVLVVKGQVERDLFIAGESVNLLGTSSIGRDVYVAGNTVDIDGLIGRNLNAGGNVIDLSGAKITGDAYVAAETITLDENTVIGGKLTYDKSASITGLDSATIGSVEKADIIKESISYNPVNSIYSFVVSAVAAFIVLLVLFYILPKYKDSLTELKFDGSTIFKTLVIGLAVLFITPIACVIMAITGFLTPLSLILLALYVIAIYVAYLSVYYIVGNLLTVKLIKKDNIYLALALGIIVTKLVILIPYVGGFISLICLLYGLGLVFDFIKNSEK